MSIGHGLISEVSDIRDICHSQPIGRPYTARGGGAELDEREGRVAVARSPYAP